MRALRRIDGHLKWAPHPAEELEERDALNNAFWQAKEAKKNAPDREERLAARIAARKERFYNQPHEITTNEIWRRQIGKSIGRDQWIDQQTRKRVLQEQSELITNRLERCGITARTGRDITLVGLISGKAERSTDYRNCNFIPVQQSRNVHQMHRDVQYYCDNAKKGSLRMLVISGGWVAIEDYRAEHRAHTRRMSKFNAEIRKRFGIELAYYNVEITINRDGDGRAMLNMHSHALAEVRQRLSPQAWKAFLAYSRNYFPKGYVHDSRIRDAKEVVKYVFKPCEFDDLTDEEFAELFHQIQGRPKEETGEECDQRALKFYNPLGRLKALRASLKRQRRKLVKVEEDGDWRWRTTEIKEVQRSENGTDSRMQNIVRAITNPSPLFSPEREPVLVVESWNGDFEGLIEENHLAEQRQAAQECRQYQKSRHDDRDGESNPAGTAFLTRDGPLASDFRTQH